ncbi:MAG: type IV pilus modification protein PilV [Betaproteobacteria bacterium]
MNDARQLHGSRGFSMLEILVTIVIVMIGLLGLAGLETRAHTAELESYQRVQAIILVDKMVEAIRSNRRTANCFNITSAATGGPYVGAAGADHNGPISCAASVTAENDLADSTLAEWDAALLGASEEKGGAQIGAMLGGRGCISYDTTTELIDPATGGVISGTGLYTVAVAWQGLVDDIVPAINCANGQYGTEQKRRVVFMAFRLGSII